MESEHQASRALRSVPVREATMVTSLISSPSQLRPRQVGGLADRALSHVAGPTRFPLLLCWHFSYGTGLPLACPPGFPCCRVTGILPESCLLDSVVLDIDGEGSTFGKWAGGRHLLETGVKGLRA